MNEAGRYYGKYRGTVVNNIDPMQMGRIMAIVTDVSQLVPGTWALPCMPIAGLQSGAYMVPAVGSLVWIEFEQGDPDHPIWVGGFYGSVADVPPIALTGVPASPSIVFQTSGQNALAISDLPGPTGGIMIKSATGAVIIVNDVGITIDNGKGASIKMMTGNIMEFNGGALTVT
ncbi:MAG: phage baseplate assembly protein V [Phycisphaerae bacterium]|nr:phage baseplate assembly protein V [Phycisphaerae bacterium]